MGGGPATLPPSPVDGPARAWVVEWVKVEDNEILYDTGAMTRENGRHWGRAA